MRPLTFGISIFSCLFFTTMSHRAYAQAGSRITDAQSTSDQTTHTKGKKGSNGSGQSTPTKSAPASGNVQFADLVAPVDQQKPKLPYGEPFTITGKLSDVCILGKPQRDDKTHPCGADGKVVTEILAPTAVGGKYVVSGVETPFTTSQVSGDSWSVTVGKLEENAPVTFTFSFSGKLTPTGAGKIVDDLVGSTDFTSALNHFIAAAEGKAAAEQAVFASAFGQTTAQKVLDLLGNQHVTATNADDFRKLLSTPTESAFGPLVNLPAELDELRQLPESDKQKLGFKDEMGPAAAYQAITKAMNTDAVRSDKTLSEAARRFTTNYEALRDQALRNALTLSIATNLSVGAGTTADDITEDLKKYAGFDVGALYIPRLNELRSFALVNIYFGPVSLQPSNGTRSFLLERLSLTFGMALQDISGGNAAESKIKGQNAFVYGIGVRLNKYFRLTTGGVVYRTQLPAINGVASPITNRLRHEFFVGPSIDVTAIPVLKGIFAKAKSN